MKYLPLNLDLWPVSRAKSKRAVSAPEVKQPQAGLQNQGGLKKAHFAMQLISLSRLPKCLSPPLILIFKHVPMIPLWYKVFYLLSYMIALLSID